MKNETITPTTIDYQEFSFLCADFMGIKYGEKRAFNKKTLTWTHTIYSLQRFYTDWNWIMDVVRKICDICFEEENQWEERYWQITDAMPNKESVIEAIAYFIKWYNKQKQITE